MMMAEHAPLGSALGARHLDAAIDAGREFERTMERVRLATGVDTEHFEKFAANVRRLGACGVTVSEAKARLGPLNRERA